MKKLIAGGIVAAAVVGGSAAVAVVNPLGIAGARTTADTGSSGTTVPGGPNQGNAGQKGAQGRPDRQAKLDEVMKGLVADGTLTQEQADKVKERLKAEAGAPGGGPAGRRPGLPGGHNLLKDGLDTAASTIGVSSQDLKAALEAGKSVADVAREHNVDPQKVIDALVAEGTKKIDDAVTSGKLPADKAEAARSRITDGVTKAVNGKLGDLGGKGNFGGRGHRPGGTAGHGGTAPGGQGGQGGQSSPTQPPTSQGGN